MSVALILEQMHSDASKLERAERELALDPENLSLQMSIGALQRRIRKARDAIARDATANQVDLVEYRVINGFDRYTVETVVDSVSAFQRGFTALYDAVKNGPKDRGRYSEDMIRETSLHLGYTFPGSFGFMLSIESERDLFTGRFDSAIDAVADFLQIRSTDDAVECSRSLGMAATARMYQWVKVNAIHGNSIDYQWRRSDDRFRGELIDLATFGELKEIFDQAADLESRNIEITGTLVGIDMERLSFHFVSSGGESYRGQISLEVAGGEYLVPHRYDARIKVESTLLPATAEKKESYTLLGLK